MHAPSVFPRIIFLAFCVAVIAASAYAETPDKRDAHGGKAADKQAGPYTLFNPTPDDKLRPMSTERPSRTDSALTLDPGRVQVEVNLLGYGYDRDRSGQDTKLNQLYLGGSTNIRVGLTENSDFQFMFDAYRDLTLRDFDAGTKDTRRGFGDLNLRYKYSFWGNHGESTALAIVPFIKLPTNSDNLANDDLEGGIELPFSITLKDGYSLGGQTMVSVLKDADDRGYSPAFTNALVLGKNITDTVSVYGEFFTLRTSDEVAAWYNTVDFGVVKILDDRWRIDAGVNIGVSDRAEDMNLFVGTAYRF